MRFVSNLDVCTQKLKVKEKVSRYDPSVYEKESKGNHPGLIRFELESGHKLKCSLCSCLYWNVCSIHREVQHPVLEADTLHCLAVCRTDCNALTFAETCPKMVLRGLTTFGFFGTPSPQWGGLRTEKS